MEVRHNQAEDLDNKYKKKLPPCKQKRNLNRLMDYNRSKKIEIINNWLLSSYTKTTDKYLYIRSGHINFEESNQVVLHFINPSLTTFPRGFAQMVALSHDDFDLNQMEHEIIELDTYCWYCNLLPYISL